MELRRRARPWTRPSRPATSLVFTGVNKHTDTKNAGPMTCMPSFHLVGMAISLLRYFSGKRSLPGALNDDLNDVPIAPRIRVPGGARHVIHNRIHKKHDTEAAQAIAFHANRGQPFWLSREPTAMRPHTTHVHPNICCPSIACKAICAVILSFLASGAAAKADRCFALGWCVCSAVATSARM
jgi:hypothetical protein